MGNTFYFILGGSWPWEEFSISEDAQKQVVAGKRPELPEHIVNSTDPAEIAISTAMDMCLIHDPHERATAREVSNFLIKALKKIDKDMEYVKLLMK